jgi:hypothetical protein
MCITLNIFKILPGNEWKSSGGLCRFRQERSYFFFFLNSNISAGNINLCRKQHVARSYWLSESGLE